MNLLNVLAGGSLCKAYFAGVNISSEREVSCQTSHSQNVAGQDYILPITLDFTYMGPDLRYCKVSFNAKLK